MSGALPDCSFDPRAVVRAGAVNAHTHLYSGLVPLGMPAPPRAPRDFAEILQLVWWRLDRALDERSLRAAARLYLAEALLAGTTTLVDHHESPGFIEGSLEVLASEAARLGARLAVAYGATERNGGREEARRGLAECARFVRGGSDSTVRGLVGLHASFTAGDETLREAGALARELGVPVHVHLAEDRADVDDARRRGHLGPLERLLALEALPPSSILAHGVWLDAAQARRAEEARAWLVQNPRSNVNNRVGYPRALIACGRAAIGTDGFPADMDAEHRALRQEATRNGDPATAAQLDARCAGGHFLAEELFGLRFDATLDAGSAGDLVVGVPGAPPRHVLVAGRVVVRDGKLVAADLDELRAHAREESQRLWRRMEAS